MRHTLLLVGVVLFISPSFAHAEDGARETWDRLHIGGARAGHVHTVVRHVTADGVTRIETVAKTDMKMKRMGATMEIKTTSVTWETEDGKLLRIATSTLMSQNLTEKIFTFKDGKVAVETTVMGTTRETELDAAGDLIGPRQQEAKVKPLLGTTGQAVSFETYIPDFERVVTSTLTSKGKESVELFGGATAELTRVEATLEGVPIKPISWHNEHGVPLKTSVDMMGMTFETYRVDSREAALAEDAGPKKAAAPEVFNPTMIRENDPVPVPRQLDSAVIVVRPKAPDVELPDMSDAGHEVTPQEDGSLKIVARRIVPPAGKTGTRPLADPPAELADALAASSMIQSDAEGIRKAAQEAVGDETDAWRTAQKLERWVYVNMTEKSMGVGFASASEALETREGDCTEHAVLLAALCRASGIPSRVVMGLLYIFGMWGGHAWNEVWIEGTWYPLDATNGYGSVDPLHIPMAHMVMKEGGGSEFVQLVMGIGRMDVDIVSVVRDGREIRVDDSATLVTMKDGVYRDAIWGLELTAPPGWSFDPPKREGMSPKLLEIDGTTAEGKKVEIEIRVMDVPSVGGITETLNAMKPTAVEERQVDGRPARVGTTNRGGGTQKHVVVAADKALYIFTLDRADGTAEQAAFEKVLQSIDFDVR